MRTALLLSGGMDSICLAYWQRPEIAITIDYGQTPAKAEINAASQVCAFLGIEHSIINVDCASIGSGDLANTKPLALAPVPEWWPFRNQLLITIAGARALSMNVDRLLIGTVASDRAHTDGSPEFVRSISTLMSGQEGGICVLAPAIELSPAELVRESQIPMGLLAWAHSCHVTNFACGACRGCAKHFTTMKDLGLDPY